MFTCAILQQAFQGSESKKVSGIVQFQSVAVDKEAAHGILGICWPHDSCLTLKMIVMMMFVENKKNGDDNDEQGKIWIYRC